MVIVKMCISRQQERKRGGHVTFGVAESLGCICHYDWRETKM